MDPGRARMNMRCEKDAARRAASALSAKLRREADDCRRLVAGHASRPRPCASRSTSSTRENRAACAYGDNKNLDSPPQHARREALASNVLQPMTFCARSLVVSKMRRPFDPHARSGTSIRRSAACEIECSGAPLPRGSGTESRLRACHGGKPAAKKPAAGKKPAAKKGKNKPWQPLTIRLSGVRSSPKGTRRERNRTHRGLRSFRCRHQD